MYFKTFLFSFILRAARISQRKQNTTVSVQGERTNIGHLISIYIVASSAFCHFLHFEQILSNHIFGFQCMEIGGKKFP